MGTEKMNTEARRRQIAEAALELIARQGVKELRVAAIARHIGLVPSALYRHFRGKDAVVDAILELLRARLLANVAAVRAETDDPLEQLRRLLLRHVELICTYQGILRLILSDEIAGAAPIRRRAAYSVLQAYLHEVAAIVRSGQKAGVIRHNAEADTVAVMFLGLIQSGAILWHMSGGLFGLEKQARSGWRVFRESIVARDDGARRGKKAAGRDT
jgi:AcrR family transcriptional regulator